MLPNKFELHSEKLLRRILKICKDKELRRMLKTYYFTYEELKLIRRQLIDSNKKLERIHKDLQDDLQLIPR